MMTTKCGKTSSWTAWALALALAVTAAACAPDIPEDPDVTRSSVVFNSAESIIPLPSDLALEDDGTLPALPGSDAATAQGEFYSYLDTLHGWLPSTGITIPVDGPVDAESVTADAVLLFSFSDSGYETIEVGSASYDEASSQIMVSPAEPLQLGTRYGYVLTQDITDPDGNPLVAPQELFFATSSTPLVDDQGNILNDLLAQGATPEEAQQLEQVRLLMKPVVDAAVAEGVDRSMIIAVSAWHTATDSFAVFDPNTGEVPFPNEFIRGDDGNVALPTPPEEDQLASAVIGELNTRDGFSITADGYIPIAGPALDPATVNANNVPIAWTEGASVNLYTEDEYSLEYVEDYSAIVFGPTNAPFVEGKLSAGIVGTAVKNVDGVDLKPSPAFVFLRSRYPLFEDGASTVEQLDDASAQALEAARQSYQQLFLAAIPLGYADRTTIAIAWAFETDVSTMYQQQLSAKAEALVNDGGSPMAAGDPATAQSSPTGFPNVGLMQDAAAYTTKFFLNPSNPLTLLTEPTDQPVPITVSVPDSTGACGAGPYPIVIVGHGLTGSRQGAVGVFANALAADPYCLATVALDFPLHGERAPSGSTSGENFISANPVATKNNFLQGVVDLAVLTEVIKDDGLEGVLDSDTGTDWIDETKIGYAGVSLGAILGTNFVATDGDVTTAALNVPGAKITQILLEGSFRDAILPQLPDSLEPGTFDFFQTFSLLQWVVEPGDPWSFAPHLQDTDNLLPVVTYDAGADTFDESGELPANQVLVQMAGQDTTIPNSTTELLAAAAGISLDDTTFPDAEHGFIGQGGEAADCALQQIGQWLSSGFGGTAELTAAEQNACGITAP